MPKRYEGLLRPLPVISHNKLWYFLPCEGADLFSVGTFFFWAEAMKDPTTLKHSRNNRHFFIQFRLKQELLESYFGRLNDANPGKMHNVLQAEVDVQFNFFFLNRNSYLRPLKFVQRDIKPGAVRPGLYRINPSILTPPLVSIAHVLKPKVFPKWNYPSLNSIFP